MYRSLVYKCGPFQAGLGTTTKQGINAVCRHTAIPIPHWKYYLCLLLNWLIWIHYKLQFLSVLNPSLVPCPPQNFSYTHTLRGRDTWNLIHSYTVHLWYCKTISTNTETPAETMGKVSLGHRRTLTYTVFKPVKIKNPARTSYVRLTFTPFFLHFARDTRPNSN